MNQQEKHAWFNLAVIVITVVVFIILIPLLGVEPARGAWGLLGLWGFGNLFYRKKRGESAVVLDERDQFIQKKSVVIAYVVFWLLFVLTCMLLWWMNKDKGTISVEVLPIMVVGGWIIVTLVQAVTMLIMHRIGRENAED